LGGSFTSSTVPFILVSVLTSYLGRFVSWAFCATKGKAERIATARKIDFRLVLHEWGMAPPFCSYHRNEAIFADSDIVLHFQKDESVRTGLSLGRPFSQFYSRQLLKYLDYTQNRSVQRKRSGHVAL